MAHATQIKKILDKYRIKEPPVDIREIAVAEGFTIMGFKPINAEQREISGLTKDKIIYLNSEDSYTRQNFTIAHELAHYFLEHDPNEAQVYYRKSFYMTHKPPQEAEADQFAAELLMPTAFIQANRQKSIEELASKFQVSKQAMRYRIDTLNESVW